jgi:hypothetical protein
VSNHRLLPGLHDIAVFGRMYRHITTGAGLRGLAWDTVCGQWAYELTWPDREPYARLPLCPWCGLGLPAFRLASVVSNGRALTDRVMTGWLHDRALLGN